MGNKAPWSGAAEKFVIAIIGGAVVLAAKAAGGDLAMTPAWPILWWMFLAGAALTAFIFHGWFVWRRDKWVAEKLGAPRLWIEQARMETVPRDPYPALRIEVEFTGARLPDFKSLTVELLALDSDFQKINKPLLYLDHNNAEFDINKHGALLVRPRDSAKREFQAFADSVRLGRGVRLRILDNLKTQATTGGLVYVASDQ